MQVPSAERLIRLRGFQRDSKLVEAFLRRFRGGSGERVVDERPVLFLFVPLEEREVEDPQKRFLAPVGEVEVTAEVRAQAAEDARDLRLVARGEEGGRSRVGAERLQLALGEELRDRGPRLSQFVVDEIREALCTPP